MNAATRQDISRWFDQGVERGATHMIVVCDTYDHDDYPVFAFGDTEALANYDQYDGHNMQRVMEVYDLRNNKDDQMNEHRAMHLPARSKA